MVEAVIHMKVVIQATESKENAECHLVFVEELPHMYLGECILVPCEVIRDVAPWLLMLLGLTCVTTV